jgi:hypothetical protein
MGTSTPAATPGAGPTITLPAGYSTGPGRETTSTNALGQVQQGVVVPVTFPDGSQITVFVPYAIGSNQQQVQALFDQRIAQVASYTSVTGS